MLSFIKRHQKLSLLFVISVFLMIKNSSIPYFFDPPAFIAFIFDAPKTALFSGVAQMVDVFASAYVTSLVFYYMVDYLPTIKQEQKAKEIISPKLVSLYHYISEFLAMIEYSARKQGVFDPENVDAMDKLSIKNEEVWCKLKSYNNENDNGTAPHSYNLLKNGAQFRNLILTTCSEISSTPCFLLCDTQAIGLVSEIQLSELLRLWPQPDDPLVQFKLEHLGLGKGYQHLHGLVAHLAKHVDTRLGCEMIDISHEEMIKCQHKQAETLKKYPEIAELLATYQMK